jgi:DNA-binding GntR family transcriptional regulator
MSHHRIDPLVKPTLASMVTDRLRELIVQGTYKAGAQLNEVELASQFGVSRGPVREGLRQLVHEGLLRSEPHRGAFVPFLSSDDIADIYHAREAIEAAALRVIVPGREHITIGVALRKMVDGMQRAVAAREWTRAAELDARFHMELVRSAGSVRLSRMYATLLDETRICLRLYPQRDDVVAEHLAIATLIEGGDLGGALGALARHLGDSIRTLSESTRDERVG